MTHRPIQILPPLSFVSLSEADIYLHNRPSPNDPDSPAVVNPWEDGYHIPFSCQIDTLF
jgi:hypothetical protein